MRKVFRPESKIVLVVIIVLVCLHVMKQATPSSERKLFTEQTVV